VTDGDVGSSDWFGFGLSVRCIDENNPSLFSVGEKIAGRCLAAGPLIFKFDVKASS
jgi:hypothetical protein